MKHFTLEVVPHSSLFVGGYAEATGASHGDTAQDATGLLLPGSTLKGALREAAIRLTSSLDRGADVVDTLFGHEERGEGILRLGALRPRSDTAEPELRHHVAIVRATRQAAPRHLFQRRITPAGAGIAFRGPLTCNRPLSKDEWGLLRAATMITDQLGGGRGRGLGHVTVAITPTEPTPPTPVAFDIATVEEHANRPTEIILRLVAREPLQLGVIKDRSNVRPSRTHLLGSEIRGAVAAALQNVATQSELEAVLGGPSAVCFGDGHVGHPSALAAPCTLRIPKRGGDAIDTALWLCAQTLSREKLGTVQSGTVQSGKKQQLRDGLRAANGSFTKQAGGRWKPVAVVTRMVTRNARNHLDGRGAPGKLFSLEVLDPGVEFYLPVRGTPQQLTLVARATREGLCVGGCRSRGFGGVEVTEIQTRPQQPDDVATRHERWCSRLRTLDVDQPERTGALLALGRLAIDQYRLEHVLVAHGLELIGGVTRRGAYGGWNRHAGLPRLLASGFEPGSVFLIRATENVSALSALEDLENDGIGPGRPDGWGRVAACHPIHLDCYTLDSCKEDP